MTWKTNTVFMFFLGIFPCYLIVFKNVTEIHVEEPSGARILYMWISLYSRFPLQDTARLQQWLRNMGRESWTPSRHQYICHEHFAPSCFKVRWGIRYLENDAVPTVFQGAEVKHEETCHSLILKL